jgi:flagellar assembly factor FliW
VKLETGSFGTLEYEEQSVIHLPEGMLGFARFKRYILVENEEIQPFKWLQSLDLPKVAFPLLDPHLVVQDYSCMATPEDLRSLEIEQDSDLVTLAVSIIPEDAAQATINLKAPLLINHRKMIGKQVILSESHYDTMVPILSPLDKTATVPESTSL